MEKLSGRIVAIDSLSEEQKDRMYNLMNHYFNNMSRENFARDLAEKPWVTLLENTADGQIQGFSTICILDCTVDGISDKAIFSGDTIIDRAYWGKLELQRVWLNFVFSLAASQQDIKWYWFLISKGYKTYRFMPVYFYDFYPRFDRNTPLFEKKLLDNLGQQKYPHNYDPRTGIIKSTNDYLKPGVADFAPKRLNNPHVRYFMEKNPGHNIGDELACIAELSLVNLKPAGHRSLNRGPA